MTTWQNPTCKPEDHPLLQENAKHFATELMSRVDSDLNGLLLDMGLTSADELMENFGSYMVKKMNARLQDLINEELATRTDKQIFTVSCTYTGPHYLKMTLDLLLANPELMKYKDAILKSFSELTEFPESVTIDNKYIIYDTDLIIGSKTVLNSQRLSDLMGTVLNNLKSIAIDKMISPLTDPSQISGATKMLDSIFDKNLFTSDTSMFISNLKLLFNDTQHASHIVVTTNGKTKSVTPNKVVSIFDAQCKSVGLEIDADLFAKESDGLFGHINFF